MGEYLKVRNQSFIFWISLSGFLSSTEGKIVNVKTEHKICMHVQWVIFLSCISLQVTIYFDFD